MHTNLYWYKGLPHLQPPGGTFFVTTRLYNSVPQIEKARLAEKFSAIRQQLLAKPGDNTDELDRLAKRYFAEYNTLLDKADYGPRWLSDDSVAGIVAQSLKYWDNKAYELIAFTILSNHIHVVFTLFDNEPDKQAPSLMKIIQSIKSFSGRRCNQLLNQQGAFWSDRNYDRLVRNRSELHRIVQYILQNPVKAGLCAHWQDWTWTYIKPDYNDFE